MNVVLIYNPRGGSALSLRQLRGLFRQYNVTIDYSFTVHQLGSRKLRSLIDEGTIVAVYGGDGTINSVARLVVKTKSSLLPLPGGTFNHFVRDVGMDPNVETILSVLSHARKRIIDVAYVNDELFLNNSNLGMYPFSLITRKETKKVLGKWPAAILAVCDQLVTFRRRKLVIDGVKLRSPFVLVGNNNYEITAALIPKRTKLDEGVLCLMVSTSTSRLELMRMAFGVARGKTKHLGDFIHETKKTIRIDSHHKELLVSLDGEVKRLQTPLLYRVRHRSLRILAVPSGK